KAFQNANQLKSDEQYPINKVSEINELIAKEAAASAAELTAINEKYNALIQEGQTALDNNELKLALSKFQDAQNTKPQELLPSEKIKEIKRLEDQMASEEEAIRIRKEQAVANEASYQTALANGDRYYAEQNWNDAENEYRLAKSLKSEEAYPQEQLDKIAAIFAKKQAELDAESREKREALEKRNRYTNLVSQGDEALTKKSLKSAKRNYEDALKIKAGEAYPIAQLAKVNELLKAEQLAEAERRRNLDRPIQIQTGPKATIDGDAEAEIERLYEELWAKQNSDKNAIILEKEETLDRLSEKNIEREEQRRQNALEMIKSISVTMKDQFKMTSELNLQNYESLKEQEEDLKNSGEYLERESQKRIENNRMDEELLADGIKLNQEERDLWIVEGKKEMVQNEYDEIKSTEVYRVQEHDNIIQGSKLEFQEIEKSLQDYRRFKNDEFYPDNYKIIVQDQAELVSTEIKDSKESYERRDEALSKSNTLATELYRNSQENSESFKNNQLEIEETEETLRKVGEELEVKAEATRNKNAYEEFYQGEKKVRQDQSAADYPQGITEEIIENQNNSTTIRRVVVEGTTTNIYEKTLYKWGGIFYTKDGNNITKDIWDKESR
ncbi:MAG: hypothetical protein JKY48_12075, partial [Flavobacteriales bacterium]|nr:hypothetical protein [Flavobacteriales bacterium]